MVQIPPPQPKKDTANPLFSRLCGFLVLFLKFFAQVLKSLFFPFSAGHSATYLLPEINYITNVKQNIMIIIVLIGLCNIKIFINYKNSSII